MLSLYLVTLGLATISAYAKPPGHSAGGLEVHLSTPTNKVASASDIKIFATVKNAGTKNLKVLKLGTVLDHESHTRSFNVTKDGEEVPFTGIAVPADDLSEKNWIVIGAGENVTAEHEGVSALYDFSASGPGTFTFDTVSTFEVIGDDATRFEIAKASSISITVTGDASRREIGLEKRRIVCGGPKGSFILSSREEAAVLAQVAISYIQGGSENAIRLINEYFGSVKDIRLLYANYENISNLKADDPTLYCEDHRGQCTPDKSAYFVFGDGVSYCDSFYKQEPLTSLCHGVGPGDGRIRGGTTFRMLAPQLMGNIAESTWVRTCTADRGGNVQNDKERNVGNYECFAAEAYKATKC